MFIKQYLIRLVPHGDISSFATLAKTTNDDISLRYQMNGEGKIITRLKFLSKIIQSIATE